MYAVGSAIAIVSSKSPDSVFFAYSASSISLVDSPSIVTKGTWVMSTRSRSASSFSSQFSMPAGSEFGRSFCASVTHQGAILSFASVIFSEISTKKELSPLSGWRIRCATPQSPSTNSSGLRPFFSFALRESFFSCGWSGATFSLPLNIFTRPIKRVTACSSSSCGSATSRSFSVRIMATTLSPCMHFFMYAGGMKKLVLLSTSRKPKPLSVALIEPSFLGRFSWICCLSWANSGLSWNIFS